MVEQAYLIRYGVMAHVGRFWYALGDHTPFERGQLVVIHTERGTELGEVLTRLQTAGAQPGQRDNPGDRVEGGDFSARSGHRPTAEIVRLPTADEIARFEIGGQGQTSHFEFCQRILRQFDWPGEIIDVEALLDDRTLILHYLGPREFDLAQVRAWFRTAHDLDVIFEPAGSDESGPTAGDASALPQGHGCGASGCGNGGCGSGAAAGDSAAGAVAHGCGISPHSGCSSCGIMRMMTERNQRNGHDATSAYLAAAAKS